jgi:hypothetical protein
MKTRQIEKSDMYNKMLVFFANPLYVAIWTPFKRLSDEIAKFVLLNTQLSKYIQQHHADTSGFTKAKNNAFKTVVKLIVKKSEKAYVWAVDSLNENLIQIFNVNKSDFRGTETMALAKIKNIRNALHENIASMEAVNLTAADITAIDAAIKNYEGFLSSPASAMAHKTEGTMALDDLLLPIDTSLGLIDNLLNSEYEDSHYDMVKEYWINRNIDKLPTHHSGLSATIKDALTDAPIKDATLSLNGKTATSDIEGLAEIIKTKPGTFMAKVTHTNYLPQEIKVVILRGKITEIDVELAKQ